jgi:Tol biopolymer transport system component
MNKINGILVLGAVVLAGCNPESPRANGDGDLLAAGIPGAVASTTLAEQDSSPMVVRRVWYSEFADLGSPSPDGTYLTFTDWREDSDGVLAVHDLRTGENRRVTPVPERWGYAGYSTVSPDGERIAYTWWWDDDGWTGLLLADFDGSKPEVLYHDESYEIQPQAWSGDGESVLVLAIDNRDNRIGLVSVSDRSLRVLKTLGQRQPFKVSISPDGRYVIYDGDAGNEPQRDIFVITVATGAERALVEHGADDLVLGWAPDGEHVLFASDRTGTLGAWLLPVTDGMPAGAPRLVKPDIWRAQPLGFAQPGAFYYAVYMHMREVFVATVDLETGDLLERPTRVSESYFGSNNSPEWSPDGRNVAYLSGRKPWREFGDEVIVIRSMETGEVKELQPNLASLMYPRWSPDGRSLLLRGKDETGRGFFKVDVQTGEVEALIRFPPGTRNLATRAEWLAGGEALLYWWPLPQAPRDATAADRLWNIRVRDLDAGSEKVLCQGEISPRFALSPDRRQLAFAIREANRASLMVMPTTGGEPRAVLPDLAESLPSEIQWGPDGRHLYYVMDAGLWRVPVAGGQPERLDWFEELQPRPFFRFQPGGQRIALFREQGQGGAELWVMEDFLPTSPAGTNDSE